MCDPLQLSGLVHIFRDLKVYSHEEPPTEWNTSRHCDLEILLPLSPGQAQVTSYYQSGDSCQYTISSNQLCIIPPYQSHRVDWQQRAEILLVYLPYESLVEAAQIFFLPEKLQILDCYNISDPLLQYICLKFRSELQRECEPEIKYLDNLKSLMTMHLLQHYSLIASDKRARVPDLTVCKIQQAVAFIHQHCCDSNLYVADVASEIGLSLYHFCHVFKEFMGISPYQYILQQRVERAKYLLLQTETSLIDVALECGFNSQSHLIRQFQKQIRVSPGRYRREHRHRI